jgi:zinc transport system substrate-binding protein
MIGARLFAAAGLLMAGQGAWAEVPRVVTDIAPVQSLVAMVMEGVGEPDVLLPAGASPHSYAMRPSEARALSRAGLVVFVSEGLTPWLHGPLGTLGNGARVLELGAIEGTEILPLREGAGFGAHEHGDDGQDHGGDHGAAGDPHLWLDPQNAALWLGVIAREIGELDPENAATYEGNAEAAQARLATLGERISAELNPLAGESFVVYHDAFQYFEHRFGLEAVGAISPGDASDPSPSHIAGLRKAAAAAEAGCILAEPQFNEGLVNTVFDGREARVSVADPLGTGFEPGAGLYPQVLEQVAEALTDCLGGS